jgi:hypothetical protein
MAGCTGAHATAKGLDAVIDLAKRFHEAQTVFHLEDVITPFPVSNVNSSHVFPESWSENGADYTTAIRNF